MSSARPNNNKWRAIGLASVEVDVTESVAQQYLGVNWRTSGHVTATEASAVWLREHGLRAISIFDLTDLIVANGMPPSLRVDAMDYPQLEIDSPNFEEELRRFNAELAKWRGQIGSKRAGFGLRINNALRTHLRNDAVDPQAGRLIRTTIQDFRNSLTFLIQSNFRPTDFKKDESVMRVAVDAWAHIEQVIPEITNVRRDIWVRPNAISAPDNETERDLKRRIEIALSRVFGNPEDRWQLFHHGFYFFVPQQWAFWQLLKDHPTVDQCFIIHDDGTNRATESWRHFFVERWLMPRVEQIPVPPSPGRGQALRDALEGRRVDPAVLNNTTKVIGFENSAEFVRHWRLQRAIAEENGGKPQIYGPKYKELSRFVDRISPGQSATSVNLANLPVGQFLLALHDCIEFGADGRAELVFTGERLLDMAASGYLDVVSGVIQPSHHLAALQRALPFFSNLRLASDWVARAADLRRMVVGEVAALGPRVEGASDVARMSGSAANELRLAPWCDLSDDDAEAVELTIRYADELGREVIRDGAGRPNDYLAWVRSRLQRAMGRLSAEQQREIEEKLGGVHSGLGDDMLDLEGVKEVVQILLGGEMEFGVDDGDGNARSEDDAVLNLRSLDILALGKFPHDIHLANLSEAYFPSKTQPYGWPFAEKYVVPSDNQRDISVEILRTRSQTAQLGDLYILWLALTGLAPDRELTMSWISKIGNELQNPSSLITLLTQPKVRNDNVIRLAGGVGLSPALRNNPQGAVIQMPKAKPFALQPNQARAGQAAAKINRAAASSGRACTRRFVMQWAMGPSASFGSEHMQSMLYGNVYGAMIAKGRFRTPGRTADEPRIRRLVSDLWRHLTSGQRKSSFEKRVIVPRGARWQWIYGLWGSQNGLGPLDLAYQAAKDNSVQIPLNALIGTVDEALLPPPGPDVTAEVCKMCPVSSRCSMRIPHWAKDQ